MGIRVLLGEYRSAEGPTTDVLEHPGVDGQRAIPTFALEYVKDDDLVAEARMQRSIKHLNQVGLSDAAPKLVNESGS
jgi:hypothetical protein